MLSGEIDQRQLNYFKESFDPVPENRANPDASFYPQSTKARAGSCSLPLSVLHERAALLYPFILRTFTASWFIEFS